MIRKAGRRHAEQSVLRDNGYFGERGDMPELYWKVVDDVPKLKLSKTQVVKLFENCTDDQKDKYKNV